MEISVILDLMFNMKSQIKIIESGRDIGIMSAAPEFFKKGTPLKERKEAVHQNRLKLGQKYNFDGNHIFRILQKSPWRKLRYKDGKYVVIEDKHLTKKDYWFEEIKGDILITSNKYKNIVLGDTSADCPILICEDRKKGYTAISHCGATYVDRKLPCDIIKALKEVCDSKEEDIYVYIGTAITKEYYIYDRYPKWAKHKRVWKNHIIKEKDGYHIDVIGAIYEQLNKIGINNIETSKTNTYSDDNFYSHVAAYQGKKEKKGQNFIGFYYE